MHHWPSIGLHTSGMLNSGHLAHNLAACAVQVTKTGEVLMVLGGADGWGPELIGKAQMAALLQRVEAEMKLLVVDVTVLRQRSVPSNTSATGGLFENAVGALEVASGPWCAK